MNPILAPKLDSGQKLDIRIILPNEGTRLWSQKIDTGVILPNEGARFWPPKLDSGQKLDIGIILPNEGTRFWSPKFDTGIILPNEGTRFWFKKGRFSEAQTRLRMCDLGIRHRIHRIPRKRRHGPQDGG